MSSRLMHYPIQGKFYRMKYEIHCDQPECPKDWEKLDPSGHGHLRFCSNCFKNVMLVETEDDVNQCQLSGMKYATSKEKA